MRIFCDPGAEIIKIASNIKEVCLLKTINRAVVSDYCHYTQIAVSCKG